MDRINVSPFRFPLLLSLIGFLLVQVGSSKAQSFEEGKELVVVRKIGHEILLKVGNTSSRVLPVKQISPKDYLLTFEHPFSFRPDSLIQVVNDIIEKHELPTNYLVNVLDCSDDSIVYAYAILEDGQEGVIPCRGREQPKKCYRIRLQFAEASVLDTLLGYIPGSLALLAGVLILFIGIRNYSNGKGEREVSHEIPQEPILEGVRIGQFLFSFEEQFLVIGDEKIRLTGKESKLLHVFAQSINRTLDRDILQQEVWGKEGVIVGRSLDMFISKLRKKLSGDPNIKLVNIHGKGYKLEVK